MQATQLPKSPLGTQAGSVTPTEAEFRGSQDNIKANENLSNKNEEPFFRYQSATQVLPKSPLQGYSNADAEHVNAVWSPAHCFSGIRSLPNALEPNFRSRLYQEIVEAGQRERQNLKEGMFPSGTKKRNEMCYSLESSQPPPVPIMPMTGQVKTSKTHPLNGVFTIYEHAHSDYEREKLAHKTEKLRNKLAQITPNDFVVKAPPAGVKHTTTFCTYGYQEDPYEALEDMRKYYMVSKMGRDKMVGGAFLAGGRIARTDMLQGYEDDCCQILCEVLSADWPGSFSHVFEDESGGIVAAFNKTAAEAEGDLSAYMNRFYKTHTLISDFHLVRDATRWGILDTDLCTAFYLFWPPWVSHARVAPLPRPPPIMPLYA